MAAIAGVMALRQDMKAREKFMWFALLLAFMGVETRAINDDGIKREAAFKAIGEGIRAQLVQTLGSDASPYFLPTFPITGKQWPVEMTNFRSQDLPIFDVSVELSKRPSLAGTTTTDRSSLESLVHPTHYQIGTALPNTTVPTPIRLEAPGRYHLQITTKRGFFYENINIDRDLKSKSGWKAQECLYDYAVLLEGKCD
jgi:hypothetical protein